MCSTIDEAKGFDVIPLVSQRQLKSLVYNCLVIVRSYAFPSYEDIVEGLLMFLTR